MKTKRFKSIITLVVVVLMVGCIDQAKAGASSELAQIGDFSITLCDVERKETVATLYFAITKASMGNPDFILQEPQWIDVPITLIDDHGNKYDRMLGINLNSRGSEGALLINHLPKGFTYIDTVEIPIPKIAPIEKVKIGDKEILFKKIKLAIPQFSRDFGDFTGVKGQKVSVGKWLSFTMKHIFLTSSGYKLSMGIENKEYNPLAARVLVGVQHNNGTVSWNSWSRLYEIKIPALSEISINRSLPTLGWPAELERIFSPPWPKEKLPQSRALLLACINVATKEGTLKIFPLTSRELPTKCAYPNRVIHTIPLKGWGPHGIAITPDGNYVYVTSGNNVSIINTSNNTVVDKIPVGYSVNEIAITPDGKFVYVSSWSSGVVSIIKTSDNTVVDKIRLVDDLLGALRLVRPEVANGIAITPDGKFVYVATWSTQSTANIWVIQTSNNTIVDKISEIRSPSGIAIVPDGKYVYIATTPKNQVWVIQSSDNAVVDKIPVADYLNGITLSPDGNYLYATGWSSVQIIKTSDNTVVDTIPDAGIALHGIAMTPDGKYIYLTNPRHPPNVTEIVENRLVVQKSAYCVTVIRTSDNTLVDKIPVGERPHGIAITPDGNYVYVTNPGDHTVSVIGFE